MWLWNEKIDEMLLKSMCQIQFAKELQCLS